MAATSCIYVSKFVSTKTQRYFRVYFNTKRVGFKKKKKKNCHVATRDCEDDYGYGRDRDRYNEEGKSQLKVDDSLVTIERSVKITDNE